MGGSVLAFVTSVAGSRQLAVIAEGLREQTAPGRAVASVLTSLLNAVTTVLLLVTHFTVPVKLLATVLMSLPMLGSWSSNCLLRR